MSWDWERLEAELLRLRQAVERGSGSPSAYSPKDAAHQLGVSVKTVRRMVKAGQLLPVTLGSRKMIPRSEIERITTPPPPKRGQRARAPPRADPRAERQRLRELLKAKRIR